MDYLIPLLLHRRLCISKVSLASMVRINALNCGFPFDNFVNSAAHIRYRIIGKRLQARSTADLNLSGKAIDNITIWFNPVGENKGHFVT
jgi:hypothetical protein